MIPFLNEGNGFNIFILFDKKVCRLVKEFGRVCARRRRKLRVNVGKSKVMQCLRFRNAGLLVARLGNEQLDKVVCFKYLGFCAAAIGGI